MICGGPYSLGRLLQQNTSRRIIRLAATGGRLVATIRWGDQSRNRGNIYIAI